MVSLDTTRSDLAGLTPGDLAYFSSDESGDERDDEDKLENNEADLDLSPDQPSDTNPSASISPSFKAMSSQYPCMDCQEAKTRTP